MDTAPAPAATKAKKAGMVKAKEESEEDDDDDDDEEEEEEEESKFGNGKPLWFKIRPTLSNLFRYVTSKDQ